MQVFCESDCTYYVSTWKSETGCFSLARYLEESTGWPHRSPAGLYYTEGLPQSSKNRGSQPLCVLRALGNLEIKTQNNTKAKIMVPAT